MVDRHRHEVCVGENSVQEPKPKTILNTCVTRSKHVRREEGCRVLDRRQAYEVETMSLSNHSTSNTIYVCMYVVKEVEDDDAMLTSRWTLLVGSEPAAAA